MPIFWLRAATFLYGLGLMHAFFQLARTRPRLNRVVLPAMSLGVTLHVVSLAERASAQGVAALFDVGGAAGLLALLLMLGFFVFYLRFGSATPGVFLFPVVCVLTLGESLTAGGAAPMLTLGGGWVGLHVALIIGGLAALFLSFVASLLYLAQARALKSKGPESGWLRHLPPLEELDRRGLQALQWGFPLLTLGLVSGMAMAHLLRLRGGLLDMRILFSLLMWAVNLLLLFVRRMYGWRGRRAARLAALAIAIAALAFLVNIIHPFSGEAL